MFTTHLCILGFASRTIYTLTRTTIVPSYQLTPEDVASLNFQTHGEFSPGVAKIAVTKGPPRD